MKSFLISHPYLVVIGIEVVKMCFNVGIEDTMKRVGKCKMQAIEWL